MFCNYLHHPGLANIQYKTFFHMCRLESISFDMESRSGSTFCLYDCLASGVIGMLTIGVHRKATTKFMNDALNFIQNQVRHSLKREWKQLLTFWSLKIGWRNAKEDVHRQEWRLGHAQTRPNLSLRCRLTRQAHQQSLREEREDEEWRCRRRKEQRRRTNVFHVSYLLPQTSLPEDPDY